MPVSVLFYCICVKAVFLSFFFCYFVCMMIWHCYAEDLEMYESGLFFIFLLMVFVCFEILSMLFCSVGLEFPKVEVRFQNLKVDALVHVGSRALPTIPNFIFDMSEVNIYRTKIPVAKLTLFLVNLTSSMETWHGK